MWRIIRRWTMNWTWAWLIVGVLAMLTRAAPFAESGGTPGDVWDYAGWVPISGLVGIVGGLVTSCAFALAFLALERLAPDTNGKPRLLVSAVVAGLALGVPWFMGDSLMIFSIALTIGMTTLTAWLMRRTILDSREYESSI
jgi:hypothetical protein